MLVFTSIVGNNIRKHQKQEHGIGIVLVKVFLMRYKIGKEHGASQKKQ